MIVLNFRKQPELNRWKKEQISYVMLRGVTVWWIDKECVLLWTMHYGSLWWYQESLWSAAAEQDFMFFMLTPVCHRWIYPSEQLAIDCERDDYVVKCAALMFEFRRMPASITYWSIVDQTFKNVLLLIMILYWHQYDYLDSIWYRIYVDLFCWESIMWHSQQD